MPTLFELLAMGDYCGQTISHVVLSQFRCIISHFRGARFRNDFYPDWPLLA
jgi:hypothetical protein